MKIKSKLIKDENYYLILENDTSLMVSKEEYYLNELGKEPKLDVDVERNGLGYK